MKKRLAKTLLATLLSVSVIAVSIVVVNSYRNTGNQDSSYEVAWFDDRDTN